MISLRWHRKTVTQRRNARAKWLPVPRFHDGGMVKGVPMEVVPLLRDGEVIFNREQAKRMRDDNFGG